MPSAVTLRTDFSAAKLRGLAKTSKDANQSRRLLSLAAVLDGMNRADAARIGGMDRQTLRDWVHRFNRTGPDGLLDAWASGPMSRLSPSQKAELAAIVEAAPTGKSMASCAGGASISSASLVSVSASPITSAMSERCSSNWASPI